MTMVIIIPAHKQNKQVTVSRQRLGEHLEKERSRISGTPRSARTIGRCAVPQIYGAYGPTPAFRQQMQNKGKYWSLK